MTSVAGSLPILNSKTASRTEVASNAPNRVISDENDGVWIPRESSSNGVNVLNAANLQLLRDAQYDRAASTTSSDTATQSLASTGWGQFAQIPRPYRAAYQSGNTSTMCGSTGRSTGHNAGFAHIPAARRTRDERAHEAIQREEKRKAEREVHKDEEDDDGSDSGWEL